MLTLIDSPQSRALDLIGSVADGGVLDVYEIAEVEMLLDTRFAVADAVRAQLHGLVSQAQEFSDPVSARAHAYAAIELVPTAAA